jgi:peptidoglycan hydrolase CwlO-like protein
MDELRNENEELLRTVEILRKKQGDLVAELAPLAYRCQSLESSVDKHESIILSLEREIGTLKSEVSLLEEDINYYKRNTGGIV